MISQLTNPKLVRVSSAIFFHYSIALTYTTICMEMEKTRTRHFISQSSSLSSFNNNAFVKYITCIIRFKGHYIFSKPASQTENKILFNITFLPFFFKKGKNVILPFFSQLRPHAN